MVFCQLGITQNRLERGSLETVLMRLVFGYACEGFFSVVLMECPEHRWHHFMGWVLDWIEKREEAELWPARIHYSLFLMLDVMYPGLPSSCCCCGLGPGTISQNNLSLPSCLFWIFYHKNWTRNRDKIGGWGRWSDQRVRCFIAHAGATCTWGKTHHPEHHSHSTTNRGKKRLHMLDLKSINPEMTYVTSHKKSIPID